MTRTPKKTRPVKLPIHGNALHNSAIQISIGGLVINWANNESVFMAMLKLLTPSTAMTGPIIWQSLRTSRPRLDLVLRLAREQVKKDATLVSDIERAISQFSGFSRVRNFYCHATYDYDMTDRAIISASSMELTDDDVPIRNETKVFNRAVLNEINDTSHKLVLFNAHLWALVERLESEFGVRLVNRTRSLPASQQPQSTHPPNDTSGSPEGQPEPSEE